MHLGLQGSQGGLETKGFPSGKEFSRNAGDPGSIPGSGKSPGGGNGNLLQYSSLENPMVYSPWGRKESDMTQRLAASFHLETKDTHFLRL